jgi:hypothetical protein
VKILLAAGRSENKTINTLPRDASVAGQCCAIGHQNLRSIPLRPFQISNLAYSNSESQESVPMKISTNADCGGDARCFQDFAAPTSLFRSTGQTHSLAAYSLEAISQIIFVGRGFSRDIQVPEKQGL